MCHCVSQFFREEVIFRVKFMLDNSSLGGGALALCHISTNSFLIF